MKTRIFYYALPFLLTISVWGCGDKSEKQQQSVDKSMEISTLQESQELRNTAPTSTKNVAPLKDIMLKTDEKIPDIKDQRMIIKTGSLSVEVDKYDEAEIKISEVVKKYNGFIANSKSSQNSSGNKSGNMTVKVPADKFDALIFDISRIGKVMNQNIQANDITEEFVDLEARVKTQKELEQRLIKLLNEKASRLSEVIEVEEKLASVRQKIESIEGRMKLLKSQSDLSTLSINIYEPSMISTSSGGGFFYELGQAIKKGLSGFTNILAVSITVLIAIIPLLVIAMLIIWIIRRVLRKRKLNKEVLK
jgi:hypothetical protein